MSVWISVVVGAVASFVGLSVERALKGKVKSGVWRFVIALVITMLLACVVALLLKAL